MDRAPQVGNRTRRNRAIGGAFVVFAGIALALAIFYLASSPSSPNRGSTSTSAEVDPGATVAPEGPKSGVDADGK